MERDDLWVAVIDYGVGNLRNVYKALEAAGAPARIVTEPGEFAGAAGIVLPGVGAFGDAAANLRRAGFERPLLDAIAAGVPLLGICVGMQLLFDESEEMGRHAGLGVIPGRVVRFESEMRGADSRLLKVPQIGWNQLHHAGTDPLLAGVSDGAYAYFVHSYYCAPDDPVYTIASTDFGIQLRLDRAPRQRLGHPVPPGEESGGGIADLAQLRGDRWRDGETRRHGDGAKT